MMEILHLTVNNKPVEVAVDPRESLADTLRERLGLTSVKKGCEVGECGACTVLVDGAARPRGRPGGRKWRRPPTWPYRWMQYRTYARPPLISSL